MRAIDRLRNGLFSDVATMVIPPRPGEKGYEAYMRDRKAARELADAIEREMRMEAR